MTIRYQSAAEAAQQLGVVVQPLGVREPDDFEQAFAAMTRELPDAILMVSDALTRPIRDMRPSSFIRSPRWRATG